MKPPVFAPPMSAERQAACEEFHATRIDNDHYAVSPPPSEDGWAEIDRAFASLFAKTEDRLREIRDAAQRAR